MISRSRACFVGLAMIAVLGFVPTTQAKTLRPDASEAFSKLLLRRQNKAIMPLLVRRNAATTTAASRLAAQQAALQRQKELRVIRLEVQIAVLQMKQALLNARLVALESIVPANPRQARGLLAQEKQLINTIVVTANQITKDERALGTPVR